MAPNWRFPPGPNNLDVHGAIAVRERFPDAVIIMLVPPSIEELERRLRGRGDTPEADILRRLQRAKGELSMADVFDHVIVNDEIDRTVEAVLQIIESGS